MTEPTPSASRREFLMTTGSVATASALAGVAIPAVHAAEDNTIHVVLMGCGGRGTGAAGNALSTKNGPIKLVAMADVFEERLDESYAQLKEAPSDKIDVRATIIHRLRRLQKGHGLPAGRRRGHLRHAPPAFRWVHFSYAIEKRINVFMEKPITVDGPAMHGACSAWRAVLRNEPTSRSASA